MNFIDFYRGNPESIQELPKIGRRNIAISIIIIGELLYGALNKKEFRKVNKDANHLHLLHLNQNVGNCFIDLMNKYALSHNLSLPDGLIAAAAIIEQIPLYTFNKKNFRFIANLHLY